MKKVILGGLVAVVVLLVISVVVLGLSLDGIVKRGVETFGPKLTQVDVKLDKVSLSLLTGGGQIGGLVVGNPEGFKSPQAIRVGTASLVVVPSSLMSDKIVIRTVRVEAPEITLETGLNGTNLKKILANLNETTASTGPAKTPGAPASGPAKKLQVDDFLIHGAKLNLIVTGLGSQTVPLPEIHLASLGQGPEGITSAELTRLVMHAIESATAKVAAEHSGDIAKSLVKGLTGSTNTAAAEKIGKGLGDLLKKK